MLAPATSLLARFVATGASKTMVRGFGTTLVATGCAHNEGTVERCLARMIVIAAKTVNFKERSGLEGDGLRIEINETWHTYS